MSGFSRAIWLVPLCLMLTGCTEITCFTSGTRIGVPGGSTPIELLSPGDSVISIDPRTSIVSINRVLSIETATSDGYLFITTESGEQVRVTKHHPFLAAGEKTFKEIGSISKGDTLWTWSGSALIASTVAKTQWFSEGVDVHHLVLDESPHTFVAENFVVRNKSPALVPFDVGAASVPSTAGWILVNGEQFLGQPPDTLLSAIFLREYVLEAVPRSGYRFAKWEGSVADSGSVVTSAAFEDSTEWVRCVFDSL